MLIFDPNNNTAAPVSLLGIHKGILTSGCFSSTVDLENKYRLTLCCDEIPGKLVSRQPQDVILTVSINSLEQIVFDLTLAPV